MQTIQQMKLNPGRKLEQDWYNKVLGKPREFHSKSDQILID